MTDITPLGETVSVHRLSPEVFCVPHGDDFLVYAPWKGQVLLVNAAAADLLYRIGAGEDVSAEADESTAQVLDLLRRHRILDHSGDHPAFPDNLAWEGDRYRPAETTLFLTSRCNLRCTYCYANGGESGETLDWEVARAAIDLVARNAQQRALEQFGVGFHGGGEPSCAWDLLVRCVTHARELGQELGVKPILSLATNGVLARSQVQWIASHLTGCNVSLDGPPDIHDRQRPTRDGRGTFKAVSRTVALLDQLELPYALRATITEDSAPRQAELVDFFAAHFATRQIHLEPLFECGRCLTTHEVAPSPETFISGFLEAWDRAQELGIHLIFSGARLGSLTNHFCGAAGHNFCVTTDALVSTCYEVTSASDPRASEFITGRYDPEQKAFAFDLQRLRALREHTVDRLSRCQDCFAKWHCAGDCPAKNWSPGDQAAQWPRCEMIRAICQGQLSRFLGAADIAPHAAVLQGAVEEDAK